MSWLRPSKRSVSDSLPSVPSKTYCFSIFSQGISRRCRLISSRSRVNCFSLARSPCVPRATHPAIPPLCFLISLAMLAMVILLRWGNSGDVICRHASYNFADYQCGHAAGRYGSRGDPSRGCQTYWTHGDFLLFATVFILIAGVKLSGLCCLANPLQNVCPALSHSASMVVLNEPERRVPECDFCHSVHLGQTILHIGNEWIRREQRTADTQATLAA